MVWLQIIRGEVKQGELPPAVKYREAAQQQMQQRKLDRGGPDCLFGALKPTRPLAD